MTEIPFVVYDAAADVAGKALHWHQSLKTVLRTAGVSEKGYARYQDQSKYRIFRNIWDDLGHAGEKGATVRRRIIQELANIDKPEDMAPDQQGGILAIQELKRLAKGAGLLVSPEELEKKKRDEAARKRARDREDRTSRLLNLNAQFRGLHDEKNPQKRGYAFERLIIDTFALADLDVQSSYSTEIDQVDGAVIIDSFTYLIEAKWTSKPIPERELAGLEVKIDRRINATRGIYVSMAGFVSSVDGYRNLSHNNRLILIDGMDFALMLEGRIDVRDALQAKIRAASIQGNPYLRLGALL